MDDRDCPGSSSPLPLYPVESNVIHVSNFASDLIFFWSDRPRNRIFLWCIIYGCTAPLSCPTSWFLKHPEPSVHTTLQWRCYFCWCTYSCWNKQENQSFGNKWELHFCSSWHNRLKDRQKCISLCLQNTSEGIFIQQVHQAQTCFNADHLVTILLYLFFFEGFVTFVPMKQQWISPLISMWPHLCLIFMPTWNWPWG